jgi:ribosome maturation factor RimP
MIEQAASGFGFEVIELDRSAGGLLRVTIDRLEGQGVLTVEDCEKLTRQLQFTLEVENIDYSRLEVGSPGVSRLLRSAADMKRFAGEPVALVLAEPLAGRKRFAGVLQDPRADGQFAIEYEAKPRAKTKPGAKVSAKKLAAPREMLELVFALHEVLEVRLDPELNFKPKQLDDAQGLPVNE